MKLKETHRHTKLRLILADNSFQHLQILKGYAQMAFAEQISLCGAFQTGADVLKALADGVQADLIITDFYLYDMNVDMLYRGIKGLHLHKEPKIIAAVEKQNEWQTDQLLSLGLECYMIKPYHMEDLFRQALSVCGMAVSSRQFNQAAEKVLAQCGLTEQRRAPYLYTLYALRCIMTSGQERLLAKEVYHQVASQEQVTISAVESALRRAAAQAYSTASPAYLQMCAEYGKAADRPLANGAFLEMLMQQVLRFANTQT